MKRKNDENCVVANMFTVFWFNKQMNLKAGLNVRIGKARGKTEKELKEICVKWLKNLPLEILEKKL